jgi:hypothetical protein
MTNRVVELVELVEQSKRGRFQSFGSILTGFAKMLYYSIFHFCHDRKRFQTSPQHVSGRYVYVRLVTIPAMGILDRGTGESEFKLVGQPYY